MSKKIIIIEDEEILLNILKDKFEEDGWDVAVAEDGQVALNKLNSEKYDLLLLDILMPNVDGFDVLRGLKESKFNKDSKVVIMSNLGDEDSIKKAMSLGATDYFIKNQHSIRKIIARADELAG